MAKCPECGSELMVKCSETGETLCGECGLVLEQENLDMGPEWRAFTPEEHDELSRAGPTVSPLNINMATVIEVKKTPVKTRMTVTTRKRMFQLSRVQTRTLFQSPTSRNLNMAFADLDRMADNLHIPKDLQEEAAEIYRKSLNKRLVRGRSISGIVAAALYAACRINGRPRSLKEIASVSRVRKKDIARCYRLLLHALELRMSVPDPKTYVSRIAAKAQVSEKARNLAIQLLREAAKQNAVIGKDPTGLAAATLYIACNYTGENRTQKEFAEAAGVTEVTVRNRYKALKRDGLGGV